MLSPELEKKYYWMSREDAFAFPKSPELDKEFIKLCKSGQSEAATYILISPNLKTHADIHVKKDEGFFLACEYNHLNVVKELLTSPLLKEHVNIHSEDDKALRIAAANDHIELVKYLLTSPDLKEHANINASQSNAFYKACENGSLNVLRYLIEENINYKEVLTSSFRMAYWNHKFDILQYLIIDVGIEYTQEIKKIIKENHFSKFEKIDEETNNFLIECFNKRKLNEKLNSGLKEKSLFNVRKNKV